MKRLLLPRRCRCHIGRRRIRKANSNNATERYQYVRLETRIIRQGGVTIISMDKNKQARLEALGFKVGTTQEFLGLTDEENAIVELRLALSAAIRSRRKQRHISQIGLAVKLKSSQSRIAKIEPGDPSVSTDLLIRALFATGATREEVGAVISAGCE